MIEKLIEYKEQISKIKENADKTEYLKLGVVLTNTNNLIDKLIVDIEKYELSKTKKQ